MIKFEILKEEHNLIDFKSGDPEIDNYLKNFALDYQIERIHKVYLAFDEFLIGYFTLSVHHIEEEKKSKKFSEISMDTSWGSYHSYVPCSYIDFIGVDRRYWERGYGEHFINKAKEIVNQINQ